MKQFLGRLSLLTKLALLILTIVIPLTALQVIDIVISYEKAREAELHASQDFAEAISATFINYIKDIWKTEASIGESILGENPLSVEKAEVYLKNIRLYYPTITDFAVLHPDGTVLASSTAALKGTSLAKREYIQKIIHGEECVLSDLLEGKSTGKLLLTAARGVREDSQLVGIIVAVIDINKMEHVFPIKRKGESASYGLIDKNGYVVFRYGSSNLTLEQRRLTEGSPAWRALQGEITFASAHIASLTKELRMGVNYPITELGWATFATVKVEEVMQPIWDNIRRELLVLLLTLVVSVSLAVVIARFYLKPVEDLRVAAQSLAAGDLNARANIPGSDELAVTGKVFDQMAERIQRLEESRMTFLQTAAHELRNPMAGIKGLLSLMRKRIAEGKSLNDQEKYLDTMEKEIDRLSLLLTKILEAFRAQRESGLLKLNLQKVDLLEVINIAFKPFSISELNPRFRFEANGFKEVSVVGDFIRLEEVMRNLYSNALKYSPKGEIITRLNVADDIVLIEVEDHGIGIPADQIESVFELFQRASNLTTQDPGGMGLGLYICREIVQAHGGKIWVRSTPGKGSTFFVQLPLHK